MAVLAVACSIARCGPTGHLPIARMTHLSGGDAPVPTRITVYADGFLEMQPLGLRKRCSRDAQAAERLLDLTRSTAFSSEVSTLNADPFHFAPSDHEQVGVEVAGLTFRIAVEDEPAAITQFLMEADTIFRRAFGRLYRISLVPRSVRRVLMETQRPAATRPMGIMGSGGPYQLK